MADGISRFVRSLELIRASGKVLAADKELLLLPLFSGLATLIVIAAFASGVWGLGLLPAPGSDGDEVTMSPALYVGVFLFYFAEYFVIIFFNTALVGAAIAKLSGGEVTVSSALALAVSRLGSIVGYALISATVGMLLRMIAERFGFIGRIVEGLIGLVWTVATFLVVPVLAAEGIGPVKAIERSSAMLSQTWGENIIGNAGISVVTGFIGVAIVLVGFGGGMLAFGAGHVALASALFVAGFLLMMAVILVGAALSGIYAGAVYYFALTGQAPTGFDAGTIRSAFTPKHASD